MLEGPPVKLDYGLARTTMRPTSDADRTPIYPVSFVRVRIAHGHLIVAQHVIASDVLASRPIFVHRGALLIVG